MEGNELVKAVHEQVLRESVFIDTLTKEVGRVIVGQHYMVDRILIALLCGGHCLIEGVPGLAKTLTVKTLAQVVDASFHRIQFTPDLLPADITGTTIYNMQSGQFSKKHGPIFANLVLADEINRAPAKVQAALLEAMEEKQVTIGDETDALPSPFMVLATQNPIDQEGTYALPEAQLDRFMLMIRAGYPSRTEEREIMDRMTGTAKPTVEKVCSVEELLTARSTVSSIYIDESIRDYIIDVVHATRKPGDFGLSELEDLVEHGASPRGSIFLAMAARAHAYLRHRGYVTPEDVKAVGHDVLRHRIALSYEAEAEDVDTEQVIQRLFETVEVP
ncbi:MAG: MoxR family ATPase [Myxococcales bacterium]|nr:MoxR family ATPase [Myxococcales bacterium]